MWNRYNKSHDHYTTGNEEIFFRDFLKTFLVNFEQDVFLVLHA